MTTLESSDYVKSCKNVPSELKIKHFVNQSVPINNMTLQIPAMHHRSMFHARIVTGWTSTVRVPFNIQKCQC